MCLCSENRMAGSFLESNGLFSSARKHNTLPFSGKENLRKSLALAGKKQNKKLFDWSVKLVPHCQVPFQAKERLFVGQVSLIKLSVQLDHHPIILAERRPPRERKS